jgi:hypothetical protein
LAQYRFEQEHDRTHAVNNDAVPASHVAHYACLANRAHHAHNKTASIDFNHYGFDSRGLLPKSYSQNF